MLNRFITVGTINNTPNSIIFRSKREVWLKISCSLIKNDAPSINKRITIYLTLILNRALNFDIARPSPLWPINMFITLFPGVACQVDEINNTSNIKVSMNGIKILRINNTKSKTDNNDRGTLGENKL